MLFRGRVATGCGPLSSRCVYGSPGIPTRGSLCGLLSVAWVLFVGVCLHLLCVVGAVKKWLYMFLLCL